MRFMIFIIAVFVATNCYCETVAMSPVTVKEIAEFKESKGISYRSNDSQGYLERAGKSIKIIPIIDTDYEVIISTVNYERDIK